MTPQEISQITREICALAPVMPVLVVDDVADAVPLAEALIDGGLVALEVTLRTDAALDVIRAMSEIPGGIVGAGTLLTPADVIAAKDAGARFGVSPGSTIELLEACETHGLPLVPGAVTATEAMCLLSQGYDMLKFFPAEASGGAAALGALSSPLPQLSFCPTGGVSAANAVDYLRLPNVVCVGGSWVAPKQMVRDGDWEGIKALAAKAVNLATQPG